MGRTVGTRALSIWVVSRIADLKTRVKPYARMAHPVRERPRQCTDGSKGEQGELAAVRTATTTPIVGISPAAPTPRPASLLTVLPSRRGDEPHGWCPPALLEVLKPGVGVFRRCRACGVRIRYRRPADRSSMRWLSTRRCRARSTAMAGRCATSAGCRPGPGIGPVMACHGGCWRATARLHASEGLVDELEHHAYSSAQSRSATPSAATTISSQGGCGTG